GKGDEGRRILHEHRLPDEEVAKVDRALDPPVRPLLERELDIAADRQPTALLGTAIRRIHDARPAAHDDSKPYLGEDARRLVRCLVVGIAFERAGRAED